MNRKQRAYDLFFAGYNCSQAVVGAFCDILKMDEEYALNLAIAFGGGFGGTRDICGAVSAMGIVVGIIRANHGLDPQEKATVYKDINKMVQEFVERNQSANCGSLLSCVDDLIVGYTPKVKDSSYFATRPCIKFVLDGVEILEKYIAEQGWNDA